MADESDSGPPRVSRITRTGERRYRTLSRFRAEERTPRIRRQLPIAELVGRLITQHGLTDECRKHFVSLYWDEIVGARIGPKTWPVRFADSVLHVETESSSWAHELQFQKKKLVEQLNAWVDANRVWLGPPPLVTDLRFELGMRRKQAPIIEREYVRQLRTRHLRRLWRTRTVTATAATDAERDAIVEQASSILDPELRRLVEGVRIKWNR